METSQEDKYLTAYEIKELHGKLEDFTSDELKQIPVLKLGTRLQQGPCRKAWQPARDQGSLGPGGGITG
ncbi:MAG: hypothetical protein RLZZ69_2569 [Cyanobacteriota bacterium]